MREPLGIIITTYNRISTALPTIQALKDNLIYEDGKRFWIIADDGSPAEYIQELLEPLHNEEYYVTNANRQGVGKSKNTALSLAFNYTSIVLLAEDDWYLSDKLNISPYADTLVLNQNTGIIRLGYLSSGTLSATLVGDNNGYGNMCYWRIDKGSDVYCYSGQISLRHKRFYEKVGYHTEGITPGEEELDMCYRYNACSEAPEILFPANIASHFQCSPFKNIGMDNSLNNIKPEK